MAAVRCPPPVKFQIVKSKCNGLPAQKANYSASGSSIPLSSMLTNLSVFNQLYSSEQTSIENE